MNRRSNRSCLLSVFAAIAPTGAAVAQQIPIDDFADGDDQGWIYWVADPTYPGVFDASENSYCIGTIDEVPEDVFTAVYSQWEASIQPACSNGTLRARVRANARDTHPALAMRWDIKNPLGYVFVADADNGELYIIRVAGADQEILSSRTSGFALREDWFFEVSAIGPNLTFKVWPVGGVEPEPLVIAVDPHKEPYVSGGFGVAVAHGFIASRISACFDDIVFTPACPSDFNLDGVLNSQDFFDFLAAFFALEPRADFNDNSAIDSQDFFDFLAAFFKPSEHCN